MNRDDLPAVVLTSLKSLGGKGSVARVAEEIWRTREADLRASGDLFYTWQYDIRWAAQKLRDSGQLVHGRDAGRPVWLLKGS